MHWDTGLSLSLSPIGTDLLTALLFEKFEILLGKIEEENRIGSNIIEDLNWDLLALNPNNETKHLYEFWESYQYTQLINEPKRTTSKPKSLIDLFLTNLYLGFPI